jgi:hypothetical protein
MMTTTWIFTHPDTWTPTDDSTLAVMAAQSDTVDGGMACLGYALHSRARNWAVANFVGSWSLFVATEPDAQYAYALMVEGAEDCLHLVWLPLLPDLLAYMRLYGDLGQANWERDEWDAMRTTVDKFFRAWHGHDVMNVCRQCDPRAYENLQRIQAERRAKVAPHA